VISTTRSPIVHLRKTEYRALGTEEGYRRDVEVAHTRCASTSSASPTGRGAGSARSS
jgi:hypothetical protein